MTTCHNIPAIVRTYVGMVLDMLEQQLDTKQWDAIRPKILKILGNRGLERALISALGMEEGNANGNI